jgi:DNA repair ATPase RecN
VLDDVVLHSDPSRKKAILRSLAELAERTQVIAFSHDPQVVALARASVHSDLLKVHEFGDGEITGELQSEIAKADVHSIRLDRAA